MLGRWETETDRWKIEDRFAWKRDGTAGKRWFNVLGSTFKVDKAQGLRVGTTRLKMEDCFAGKRDTANRSEIGCLRSETAQRARGEVPSNPD